MRLIENVEQIGSENDSVRSAKIESLVRMYINAPDRIRSAEVTTMVRHTQSFTVTDNVVQPGEWESGGDGPAKTEVQAVFHLIGTEQFELIANIVWQIPSSKSSFHSRRPSEITGSADVWIRLAVFTIEQPFAITFHPGQTIRSICQL